MNVTKFVLYSVLLFNEHFPPLCEDNDCDVAEGVSNFYDGVGCYRLGADMLNVVHS